MYYILNEIYIIYRFFELSGNEKETNNPHEKKCAVKTRFFIERLYYAPHTASCEEQILSDICSDND